MPKVNLKVPKRSGFDKSHTQLLTADCGTLVPILCDELIPDTKVYLRDLISAQLPPLATDTFMRVNLKVEAFFCPTRLLYGGYAEWLTKEPMYDPAATQEYAISTPIAECHPTQMSSLCGTLADYLGIRNMSTSAVPVSIPCNIYPFLAYHRIYDDWYRNTLSQRSIFYAEPEYDNNNGEIQYMLYNLPFVKIPASSSYKYFQFTDTFADGVKLNELRQRNFGFDYFTNALPSAQLGSAQSVSFATNAATGSFTIASLRAANSLQQFAERNQLAGYKLQDFVKANYGADLSSGVAQRAIYLGSSEIPVYSKGVYTTANDSVAANNNPFATTTAAKFGDASANGEITLVKDFVANEPGYLIVLASLVPVVAYASGIDRMFYRYTTQSSQTDLATPLLQNVGNQPIYMGELTGAAHNLAVFGYTDRYADFKQKSSQIHGLLRDGSSLESFALQRSVTGSPTISDTFLQIPTDYMDQVTAVNDSISDYGIWINVYHDYKVSMPLAEYSIPSLQDPAYEHGNDVQVQIGGSRL